MNNPCVPIFYNLDEMDQFSEKHDLLKHTEKKQTMWIGLYLQKKMSQ